MTGPPPTLRYAASATSRPGPLRLWGCLLVVALLIAGVLLKPMFNGRPAGEGPAVTAGTALQHVVGPYPSPMSIDLASDGAVWLTTKYDVTRYGGGDPRRGEVLLDSQIYERRFGRTMNSPASATLTPDGVLFTGSWYGEVLSFADGRWTELIAADLGPRRTIAALVVSDDAREMWIGADNGLWLRRESPDRLDRLLVETVYALARLPDGRLAVGTWAGVYLGMDRNFYLAWEAGEFGPVESLAVDGELLLVGTHDGFLALDGAMREVDHQLPGSWVTGFLDAGDRRLVATWEQGMFVETREGWKKLGDSEGLPGDSVTSLLVGPGDRLWAGFYGEGTWTGELRAVVELAQSQPPP